MKQHGFKAISSAQIAKDYGSKNESVVTESKEEIVVTCPDMSLQEIKDIEYGNVMLSTQMLGKLVGKDEVAGEELKQTVYSRIC